MLLAINANNTNTVFAVWDGADLKGSWRTATEGKRTADEYVVWLDHLLALEGLSRGDVDGAVIASVVPEANFNLVTLCRKYCQTEPLVVGEPGVDARHQRRWSTGRRRSAPTASSIPSRRMTATRGR